MITNMARKSTLNLKPLDLGEFTLGQRIANFRKDIGLTQVQLADKMGIVQTLVSDYERDKLRPHPEMLVRFAIALEISLDELMGLKESNQVVTTKSGKNLLKKLHQAVILPASDQKVLLSILEGLLAKNQLS